jgi:uncharacterized membrane protein YhfC
MIAIPVGLVLFVNSKFHIGWKLWWIGGMVFILSQVGHIPFNYLAGLILNKTSLVAWPRINQILFNSIFLGLSAGLWEESARYAMYRWWSKESRSWRSGISLGIGHGGFESFILGAASLYTLIQLLAVKNLDISTLVPREQLTNTMQSISSYLSMPWYDALMGSAERILAIPVQIACSVLILQAFIQKNSGWVFVAIFFHAAVDCAAVLFISFTNVYITELVVALFSLVSLLIIFHFKKPDLEQIIVLPDLIPGIVRIKEIDETNENLDYTKYQ